MVTVDLEGTQVTQPWGERGPPPWKVLSGLIGGGYIERVQVRFENKIRDAYVDEDGKPRGMPLNPHATKMLTVRYFGQTLCGKMVIWIPDPKPMGQSVDQRVKQKPKAFGLGEER